MLSRVVKRSVEKLHYNRFIAKVGINQTLSKGCFHLSAVTCTETFVGTEFRKNFQVIKKYFPEMSENECKQTENSIVASENYNDKSADELLKILSTLSYQCDNTKSHIAEDIYDNLVQNLLRVLPNVSDVQLAEVMKSLARFPPAPNVQSKNFHELWQSIDQLCCKRIHDWDRKKMLQFCYQFLNLHLLGITDFPYKAITKICSHVERLTAKEFIATMFFLTIARKKVSMIAVEMKFHKCIDLLSIDEIGIIGLAFFKTETKLINEDLIKTIYKRLIKEIDTIEDIPLVNILKILLYSTKTNNEELIVELCSALLSKADDLSLVGCFQVAMMGTVIQYCHQDLFEKLLKKINDNIKQAKLKDIERITFAMGLYDFKSESGVEKKLQKNIIEDLKLRVKEIVDRPKSFSAIVHFLSILGEYDVEFVKSVLNEDFIKFAYGKNLMKLGLEILSIDSYARINLGSIYDGPLLSEKMRANINKYQIGYVPYRGQEYKLTNSDKQLLTMKEMLELEWGENILTHILPHFPRPDIVYCFDESRKSVTKELVPLFSDNHRGLILSKEFLLSKHSEFSADDINKYRMVAVVIGGWNSYIHNSRNPTGLFRMKLEQLKMIGYTTVAIQWQDWSQKSEKEGLSFLNQSMREALES